MKRALLLVVSCVTVSALATVSVVWWSNRAPQGRSVQVSFQGLSYGLERINTPILDKLGVQCVPSPAAPVGSNEEWPAAQTAPDPRFRESLSAELREAYDCLLNCLPTDPSSWSGDPLSSARPCFEKLVIDLALSVGFIETFEAMGAVLDTHPQLTFFCHEAGHKSGAAAFEAGVPLEQVLPVVGDYCVHGAMHGILDGFAFSKPTIEDFDRVAAICSGLTGGAAGGCTDGMGHAAWDAFGDFAMTSQACATIDALELRYACDEGVLMRRYERIGTMRGTETSEFLEHASKLRADCAEWEKASSRNSEPGGSGGGCWAAVQYMLWEPVVTIARIYPEERWRGVENLDELLAEIRSTCASFGPVGEDLCRGRDGYHVATLTNYRAEDFEPVCKILVDRVSRCVEMANELTRSNSSR